MSSQPLKGGRFSKIGGLLASVPSVSCPNFRAASLRKIVSKLFCRTGTLATQASDLPFLHLDVQLFHQRVSLCVLEHDGGHGILESILATIAFLRANLWKMRTGIVA